MTAHAEEGEDCTVTRPQDKCALSSPDSAASAVHTAAPQTLETGFSFRMCSFPCPDLHAQLH